MIKQTLRKSFLLSRRILGTVLPALFVGGICVSSAHASLFQLEWVNGGLTTTGSGVSGSSDYTSHFDNSFSIGSSSSSDPTYFDGQIITLTITALPGYDLTGITASYYLNFYFEGGTTATTTTYGGTGGGIVSSTSPDDFGIGNTIPLNDLTSGNSETLTFTLGSTQIDPSGSITLSFYDTFIDRTVVTAVSEPINYALAGFGKIFVGRGAGRFYLARRRSTTAS